MTARTARFWIVEHESPIKITLRPGQSLTWAWWAKHEEGWSSEVITWTHAGDAIERETCTDGRDCDGRSGAEQVTRCPLAELAAWDSTLPGVPMLPAWEVVTAGCYDQTAEAAGY